MSAPRVIIIEEPASKTMRFRYECEGRSAGSIPGANSTSVRKTYPTIKVLNYTGPVHIVTSCVTSDKPYRPHPHKLISKEGCSNGISTVTDFEVTPDNEYCFRNLGIQCVKKTDVEESLKKRKEANVDPFKSGFIYKEDYRDIDLNSVRLCFQVLLKKQKLVPLPPVVSAVIHDKKTNSDLVIFRISDATSHPNGGKQIILLCEKVAKDDIKIRFYELKDNKVVWEDYGDFQVQDVHRQVAIAFRTPRYRQTTIGDPVDVFITLQRKTDGFESKPLPFQYIPDWNGSCCTNIHTGKKRKIAANKEFYEFIKTQKTDPVIPAPIKTEVHGTSTVLTTHAAQPIASTSTYVPYSSNTPQGAVGYSSYANYAPAANPYYDPNNRENQYINQYVVNPLPPCVSNSHWNIPQNTQMYTDPPPQTSNNHHYPQNRENYAPPQIQYNIAPLHNQSQPPQPHEPHQQHPLQQHHHHHHQTGQVANNNYQHLQFLPMLNHTTNYQPQCLDLNRTDLQMSALGNVIIQPAVADTISTVTPDDVENMTDSFSKDCYLNE